MAELHGLKIPDLPEGAVPLRVLALVEVLTTDGSRQVVVAATDDILTWEAAGMAVWLDQRCRSLMQGGPGVG